MGKIPQLYKSGKMPKEKNEKINNYLRELPENNPKSFAKAIKTLADLNNRQKYTSPGIYLQNELQLNEFLVSSIFNGRYISDKQKQMSIPIFRKIIEHFWGKPIGINHPDEVVGLARCAGPKYLKSLNNNDWFYCLTKKQFTEYNAVIPTEDFLLPKVDDLVEINRDDILEKIFENSKTCMKDRSRIVLYGSIGIGKTKVLNQVEKFFMKKDVKFDIVLSANFKEKSKNILRKWYQKIIGNIPYFLLSDQDSVELKNTIAETIFDKRCLILIDHVTNLSEIENLPLLRLNRSLIIICTNDPIVCRELITKHNLLIEIPGFTDEEAIKFYQFLVPNHGLNSTGVEQIQELNKILEGNPFCLSEIFTQIQQQDDLQKYLNFLKEPTNNTYLLGPSRTINNIFEYTYSSLFEFEQELLEKIGSVPLFKTYNYDFLQYLWNEPNPSLFLERFTEFAIFRKNTYNSYLITDSKYQNLNIKYNNIQNKAINPIRWETVAEKSIYLKKYFSNKYSELKLYRSDIQKIKKSIGQIGRIRSYLHKNNINNFISFKSSLSQWELFLPPVRDLESNEYVFLYSFFYKYLNRSIRISKVERLFPFSLFIIIAINSYFVLFKYLFPLEFLISFFLFSFSVIILLSLLILAFDIINTVAFLIFLEFGWERFSNPNDIS